MKIDLTTYKVIDSGGVGQRAKMVGIVGLVLSLVGYFINSQQFFYSYLTAFTYWTTIALGGLFFTLLHHLVGAKWSVVLKRLFESAMSLLPFMALFFIPIFFGLHDLYHWTHQEMVATDKILQAKSAFLNIPFFTLRSLIYLSVWVSLPLFLNRYLLRQTRSNYNEIKNKIRRYSGPAMIFFAFSLTFASFDWLMSLDPHWYSTIFGVYVFSGTVLIILAFITFAALFLRGQNMLSDVISIEHYYDLGKLLFGFTIFWAYIAFVQYFLIWYANIPEETIWYLHRWEGSWKYASILLLWGHFILPFLILLGRAAKRNYVLLKVLAVWFFFIHWVDLHWLIMPQLHSHGIKLSWMDATTWLGIGGIFVWLFWKRLLSQPILAINDPDLEESIKHRS